MIIVIIECINLLLCNVFFFFPLHQWSFCNVLLRQVKVEITPQRAHGHACRVTRASVCKKTALLFQLVKTNVNTKTIKIHFRFLQNKGLII